MHRDPSAATLDGRVRDRRLTDEGAGAGCARKSGRTEAGPGSEPQGRGQELWAGLRAQSGASPS